MFDQPSLPDIVLEVPPNAPPTLITVVLGFADPIFLFENMYGHSRAKMWAILLSPNILKFEMM